MVQVYMRLSEEHTTNKVGFLVFDLHPDQCLDELQVMCQAMKPKRVMVSTMTHDILPWITGF